MVNQQQKLFRQESLVHLSSPERLDQLMQVVVLRDWLVLATLGALVMVGVGWSIWGKIPITVTGRGVLVYPHRTAELQVPVAGQLKVLQVKLGDQIRRGQVIGLLDRNDLRQALQQQTLKLRALEQQNQQLSRLTQQRTSNELQTIQQKRQALQQMLRDKQSLSLALKTNDLLSVQKQRQTLERTLKDKQVLSPIFKQQLERRRQLQAEGAISADTLLDATRAYQENLQQIDTLKVQLQELRSKEVAIEQTYRDTVNQVADLQTQIQQLQGQEQSLAQRSLESAINRTNQIQDVKQKIAQINLELQKSSRITSDYDGRIVELSVKPGDVLNRGVRLAVVETAGGSRQLVSMTYFPIKDGKRIQPGTRLQITPDTVKRERFGGIVGEVQSVSALPVSKQSVINAVGNAEVADSLVFQGGQIEVLAALKTDPTTFTGYQWSSSKGPDIKLTSGTTVSVRATVDQQAPITFVLPILKSISNIN